MAIWKEIKKAINDNFDIPLNKYWESKTSVLSTSSSTNVSGSGYLISVGSNITKASVENVANNLSVTAAITIDGVLLGNVSTTKGHYSTGGVGYALTSSPVNFIARFETSLDVTFSSSNVTGISYNVFYVLD